MTENRNSSRFRQYLVEKRSEETQNVLSDLFGEDAGSKATKSDGIYQAQIIS